MASIIIRSANQDDIPAILPLIDQLGYPNRMEDLSKRLKKFTEMPGYGVAVATIDDIVAGWVAWSSSSFFVFDQIKFRIEGLIVSSSYREKGIGKELMRFVEATAQEHSPCIIELTSGMRRANEGTHEFYKKLGYSNEGHMAKLYLRKEL